MTTRWTAALLALVVAVAPVAAQTSGPTLVRLSVVDRDSGVVKPEYPHAGRRFVAADTGARYSVRLANLTDERVLVVLSVDGVNAVSGETAAVGQRGYILTPPPHRRHRRVAQERRRDRRLPLRPARPVVRRADRAAGRRRRDRHRGVPRAPAAAGRGHAGPAAGDEWPVGLPAATAAPATAAAAATAASRPVGAPAADGA